MYEAQDCKDESGFQFIKFEFMTDGQEIKKIAILINCFQFFSFIFKDNTAKLKRTLGHNHENTIC